MFLTKIINGVVFLSLLFLLVGVIFPQRVFAVADSDYGLTATQQSAQLPDNIKGQTGLVGVIGLVVKLLLSFTGMFFLGMMLYAGIVWMKSMGASDDVQRAKDVIQSAIIGLIIVSAAYAITNFVFTNLSTSTKKTPDPVAEDYCKDVKGVCGNIKTAVCADNNTYTDNNCQTKK